MPETKAEPRWILALEWGGLILIVALATYLRYWRLGEVPPGFNSDEAVGAMGALTTLREGVRYSYEGQGGGGALGFYFATAAFYLFGPSIASIRGLAAWAGVVSVFVNYWAVREVFRPEGLTRARWVAGLSTLGLAVSIWHIWSSRVAFATIGVPFLMLPSVYFLWAGLNRPQRRWPFVVSGIFLGGLMYIYLSGVFAPPLYAAFFIGQWLTVKVAHRFKWPANPNRAYLTTQFWNLFATALTAAVLLLPMIYVFLTRPELDPSTTRVGQAIFTNPQINQGDPWGLLWRSFVGNFAAYGVSLSWLIGQVPRLTYIPTSIGLLVFIGFLISLGRGLSGRAAYLFVALWYAIMLLPSILSPDTIPHNLRTIGATTPTYVFAALAVVTAFDLLLAGGRRWLAPRLGRPRFNWLARAVGVGLGVWLGWQFWQVNRPLLYDYFYVFPQTNDAKAAFHVYAVDMAETIKQETRPEVAFILPRNTAAGDVFRNFTTDFLTELEQPPAAHYWVIDDERTLAADLTRAAADHSLIRVVEWKTSKHTGADPKEVIPYYLEKYGHFVGQERFEYYNIDTYQLDMQAPDFDSEQFTQTGIDFGQQLKLTGYAFGDAGAAEAVNQPQAHSNDLLWLRLSWQKTGVQPEDLKVSALVYTQQGQLVTQIDKQLISNILQVGSRQWEPGATEETYFLIPVPPATPPGPYQLRLAVYGAESLARLPVSQGNPDRTVALSDFQVRPAQKPVPPEALELALPVKQELLPGLKLVGFETLPGESVRSGQQVGASLIWQAGEQPPVRDIAMELVVKPGEGKEEWTLSEPAPLAGAAYPSSQWRPGELLRGWLITRIPPALEPGLYELSLRLTSANPGENLLTLPVGEFTITGWPRNFERPQPQLSIGADFGGLATLVGIDAASQTLTPGETLNATLYWGAEAEFEQDYTAFVQLIGPDGKLHGQVDQTPGAGQFPTSGWLPGEFITDPYAVPLAPTAPAGDYQLAIGLYNPNSGERLPVSGELCQTDVCLLPGLRVK